MITKDQWYKHSTLQQELAEILKMPAIVAALEICRDQELIPVSRPGQVVNLVDYFALMGMKREGYLEFLTNLHGLSRPKATEVPAKRAWDYDEPTPETAKK